MHCAHVEESHSIHVDGQPVRYQQLSRAFSCCLYILEVTPLFLKKALVNKKFDLRWHWPNMEFDLQSKGQYEIHFEEKHCRMEKWYFLYFHLSIDICNCIHANTKFISRRNIVEWKSGTYFISICQLTYAIALNAYHIEFANFPSGPVSQ